MDGGEEKDFIYLIEEYVWLRLFNTLHNNYYLAHMPVKAGEVSSIDYKTCKDVVYSLDVGHTINIDIEDYKRCQKYLYEIGLKCKPRREYSTKKLTQYSLRVTRIV